MRRFCLDTSAYSHFVRGEQQVNEFVKSATQIEIPVVVLAELRVGFLNGSKNKHNLSTLAKFCEESVVRVLTIDDETAQIYADIIIELKKAGKPIPTNDVWIAACAAQHGSPVLTFDAHFRNIARVATILIQKPS